MFLLETDRLQKQLSELVSKAETAQTNLDETNLEYEKIKKEHSRIEEELEELNTSLDAAKEAAVSYTHLGGSLKRTKNGNGPQC